MEEIQIQEMLGPPEPEHFYVAPENWPTVEVFLSLKTQWKWIAGMGGAVRIGLDYTAVESVMRMLKVRDRKRMFNGLLIMEFAALEVWNNE